MASVGTNCTPFSPSTTFATDAQYMITSTDTTQPADRYAAGRSSQQQTQEGIESALYAATPRSYVPVATEPLTETICDPVSSGATSAIEHGARPNAKWIILPYDTQRFPFAKILQRDVYPVLVLDQLHRYVIDAQSKRLGHPIQLNTQHNLLCRKLMQALADDSPFYKLYHHFMKAVLAPLVGRTLSYSCHPKMRIHFPDTPSVSSFHCDVPVTCRPDQINFWMPFTNVQDSATLWLESDYGKADYRPVPLQYGQVLIFDGGYLGHGSVANVSDVTRISLDMRFSLSQIKTREGGIELMNRLVKRLADFDVLPERY